MTYDEAKLDCLKLKTLPCPACRRPIILDKSHRNVCANRCGTFGFFPHGLVDAKTGQDCPNSWVFYHRFRPGRKVFDDRHQPVDALDHLEYLRNIQ